MSGRELVILLLGLAIVAVVLRGLYVAINARRGQIKLAIDKNIPQDVDLESLELAELPGGGARVVSRSLEEVNRQNNAIDLAESKARSLKLAASEDKDHIPVLMDAVAVSEASPRTQVSEDTNQAETAADLDGSVKISAAVETNTLEDSTSHQEAFEEEVDFLPPAQQEHSIGANWDEMEPESGQEQEQEPEPEESVVQYSKLHSDPVEEEWAAEEADADLTICGEETAGRIEIQRAEDTMSAVAPDYDDMGEEHSSGHTPDGREDHALEDASEDYSPAENNSKSEFSEAEIEPQPDEESQSLFDADRSADEFSMTAGERIGAHTPVIGEGNQSGLFDDDDEDIVEAAEKSRSRRSLFSLFGRKSKNETAAEVQEPAEETSVPEHADVAIDEISDVLLNNEPLEIEQPQTGPEQAEQEEIVAAQTVTEEEGAYTDKALDELDQKRIESAQQEAVEENVRSDEIEHSEVLVLNVMSKEGRVFAGDDLLHVLITAGLKFGDMNIFHKRLSKEHHSTVVFSVANMLNPGTFDLNNMEEFTTLGISFFLALPSPINNLDAFEQMLGIAQEIQATLGGDLKDDHRNGMTGQTIEHYRQRIRDFELRRLKAVAARG